MTQETRELMAQRDLAHEISKESKNMEDIRYYKNIRNQVNQSIAKEKFLRKKAFFSQEEMTVKEKWEGMKRETGQKKYSNPQVIVEGKYHYSTNKDITSSLNRQYIMKVKQLIQKMENIGADPLVNYRKVIPSDISTFSYKQVSIHQLKTILHKMRGTGSMGEDDVCMRNIKQASTQLLPLLLHMVNAVILKMTYPKSLKTNKVIPITKKGKDQSSSDGWRPVNVVNSLSKIIERVLLAQMLEHLSSNEVVGHQHHGAVKNRSTQTLITELYDELLENLNDDKEMALIILDQSKAFDVIDHKTLLAKLRLLGYSNQAINILSSFLSERKQFVQVQGTRSEILVNSPNSVIQGSTLSSVLYLIYVLDAPLLFHQSNHNPIEYRKCQKPSLKTFVDDMYIVSNKEKNKELSQTSQRNNAGSYKLHEQ